jgi:hypothetical protein
MQRKNQNTKIYILSVIKYKSECELQQNDI